MRMIKDKKEELAEDLSNVISKALEVLGEDAEKLPWFASSIKHEVEKDD